MLRALVRVVQVAAHHERTRRDVDDRTVECSSQHIVLT